MDAKPTPPSDAEKLSRLDDFMIEEIFAENPMESAPQSGFFLGWADDDIPEVWSAEQYWLCMSGEARPGFPVTEAKALVSWSPLPERPAR